MKKNGVLTDSIFFLMSDIAEIDQKKIQLNDHLRDDLGLDSVKSMELLSRVSEKFEIDVELEDVFELETVGDIVRFLENNEMF